MANRPRPRKSSPLSAGRASLRLRAALEPLERRAVLATVSVGVGDIHGLDLAIADLNAIGGSNTIELSPGLYDFGAAGAAAITDLWFGPNYLPAIASNLTIEGNGAVLQGGNGVTARFFFVSGGFVLGGPAAGTLTLNDLTLQGGSQAGGDSNFGGGGLGAGGAIFNMGTLNLNNVTFTSNSAVGGTSTGVGSGGYGGGGMGTDSIGDSGGGDMGPNFPTIFGGAGGVSSGKGTEGGGGGGGFTAAGGSPSGYYGGDGGGSSGLGGSGGDYQVEQAKGTGQDSGDVTKVDPAGGGLGGDGGGGAASNGGGSSRGGSPFGIGGNDTGGGGVGGGGGGQSGGGGFGGGGGADGVNGPNANGASAGAGGFGGGGGGADTISGASAGAGGFGGGDGNDFAGGGGAGLGGAIFNMYGTVNVVNCTFSGNQAIGGGGAGQGTQLAAQDGQGLGSALFNLDGAVTISGSTGASNSASTGGAVYNLSYGFLPDGATSAATSAGAGTVNALALSAAGRRPATAVVRIQDSILTGTGTGTGGAALINNRSSGAARVIAIGANIVRGYRSLGGATRTGPGFRNVAPKLGPLRDNGGRVPTMALLKGSPAIDAGPKAARAATRTDARGPGFPRAVGKRVDLGAFESQSAGKVAKPARAAGHRGR